MMKVYASAAGSFARKIRVMLLEKGVEHELRLTNLWEPNELHQVNPLGKVPVLQLDDGQVVVSSPLIAEYIAFKYPSPRLVPEDFAARMAPCRLPSRYPRGNVPAQGGMTRCAERAVERGGSSLDQGCHLFVTYFVIYFSLGAKSGRDFNKEARSMSEINNWLQETKARSELISEGYRLELTTLWWANLMFVVVPAVLSTAAAIFAALPQETAGKLAIGALSLPLASVFAGSAAILMAIHKALKCDEYQAECLRLAQLHQSIAISTGSALSRPEGERIAHQERIAAKLEEVTEGAKARLPTRMMLRAERMTGVKFYAHSAA